MGIHYCAGDVTKTFGYICHQVNCRGAMNSGVAKAIRNKWPVVYNAYQKVASPSQLGSVQSIRVGIDEEDNDIWVINMFAQDGYGYDGRRYTSYDAFWSCLGMIKEIVPKGSVINFPGRIGSDRGGANWNVIHEMISEVLADDYEVFIYFLNTEPKKEIKNEEEKLGF